MKLHTTLIAVVSLFMTEAGSALPDNDGGKDRLTSLISTAVRQIPSATDGLYVPPNQGELDDWRVIADLFSAGRPDSCKILLARYNYALTTIQDGRFTYDIISEQSPVLRGWGTFVYNRNSERRLNVHVNHPIEDGNIPLIGAELYRRYGGKWFLMAGSSKYAYRYSNDADAARNPATVLQLWHEATSALGYVSLSMHGYNPESYPFPVSASDIIISNGRTTDDQWGISQISLALRDSLRKSGFRAALSMLDSGFARLSGGSNPQGRFANDKFGFGHWLYVELSEAIRNSPSDYQKFLDVTGAALEITGKPISKQINHAFGLVSPRVVRIETGEKLKFSTPEAESYRLISVGAGHSMADTLDLLFGNWMEGVGRNKSVSRVIRYDSSAFAAERNKQLKSSSRTMSAVVQNANRKRSSGIRPAEHEEPSSQPIGDEETSFREPIQVHKIPLQPVFSSTVMADYIPATTPFRWAGMVPDGFAPQLLTYGISPENRYTTDPAPGLSKFLIPLLHNSYDPANRHFVGVQMTELLINEIARLVNEYDAEGYEIGEIGLMAEQSDAGNYYLRLFAGAPADEFAQQTP